jgi:hypothetical protein
MYTKGNANSFLAVEGHRVPFLFKNSVDFVTPRIGQLYWKLLQFYFTL